MIEIYSIINATPDSFYAGSRVESERAIIEAAQKALSDGGDVLDVGGYSTRPNHSDVSEDEELRRLRMALKAIKREFPAAKLSVDTFRSSIVQKLYDEFGEFIVNDIQGGAMDMEMIPLCARLSLRYVMMSSDPTIETISKFFNNQLTIAHNHGLHDVVLDPGFGFGKTVEDNFEVLGKMEQLKEFGLPIFAGLSRKSMIWRTLEITASEALNGTTALNFAALMHGATILRVHDTLEARECITLFEKF